MNRSCLKRFEADLLKGPDSGAKAPEFADLVLRGRRSLNGGLMHQR